MDHFFWGIRALHGFNFGIIDVESVHEPVFLDETQVEEPGIYDLNGFSLRFLFFDLTIGGLSFIGVTHSEGGMKVTVDD